MGKKIGKFIKYALYVVCGLLAIFISMVLYQMKSMESDPKYTKEASTKAPEETREYTREELIEIDTTCWAIVTETEKALNNLIEGSTMYDNGQTSKNDLYTYADKVYKFVQNKQTELREVDISPDAEYKKLCGEYLTNTLIIADNMKVYLDKGKQQALTDAKEFITYNRATANRLVVERMAYLVDNGLSEEDIQAITSIK